MCNKHQGMSNLLIYILIAGFLTATIIAIGTILWARQLVQENRRLNQENQVLKSTVKTLKHEDVAEDGPTTATTVENQVANDENDNTDHQLFVSIEKEIISRRLYAANLNREQLIKELGIPRAQFATLFRNQSGETYTKYMNKLRLREAVVMMQDSPNKTIDQIATECGMSRQLFYKLFKEQYGITPTEFRASHNS